MDRAIVFFRVPKKRIDVDLDIPLDITANELVIALSRAYMLDIDVSSIRDCYLKSENPIALLKGDKLLSDYGIRNGSIIYHN